MTEQNINRNNTLTLAIPYFARAWLISLVFAVTANCIALEVPSLLPDLTIDNAGEMTVVNGKSKYINWSSSRLSERVTVLQILAASQKAADLNMPFLDKFTAQFEADETTVGTTTIIVSKKIPSLLSGFVKRELKSNKAEHPLAIMVNDKKGKILTSWSLPDTLAILMLVDNKGVVQKYHEGKLPTELEDEWISTLAQLLDNQPNISASVSLDPLNIDSLGSSQH